MKLGLENKKKAGFLGGLVVLLAYAMYANLFSGASAPEPKSTAATPVAALGGPQPDAASAVPRPKAQREESGDFHPVFQSRRPEDRIDPMTVDPTLHLELLRKLQDVAADSGGRNLFQFGQPPPPPPTPEQIARLNHPEPIVRPQTAAPPPVPSGPPQPAPPPPIPLKYYGLSTARSSGKKIAFFLDGETILMAGEGELLQKRYRVVRIGTASVLVEDTQQKREQTIPLAADSDAPQMNSAAESTAPRPEAAPNVAAGPPGPPRPFAGFPASPVGFGRAEGVGPLPRPSIPDRGGR